MSGLVCAGDLYIALYDDAGALGGYLPPVNATKMAVSATGAETIERISKMRDTYGQVLDSVSQPQPHEVAITLDEFSGQTMALAFSGSVTALNETGSTVADEAITVDGNNWNKLAHRHTSAFTVQDVTDTTTYVEGTDYELNNRIGMIRALPGGAISDTDVLHVDYTYTTVTGDRTAGATQSQIMAALILDGKNLADNTDIIVWVDKVVLAADNEVDFLADEFPGMDLSGKTVTLTGGTEPYRIDQPTYA